MIDLTRRRYRLRSHEFRVVSADLQHLHQWSYKMGDSAPVEEPLDMKK